MYTYNCKINKVIDGDTINVDIDLGFNTIIANQVIRLYGIDAPESKTKDAEEKIFGTLSKKVLAKKLPVGQWFKIKTIKEDGDDKYGRFFGRIYAEDGTEINQWMVDNNYAVQYKGEDKNAIQADHLLNRSIIKNRSEV